MWALSLVSAAASKPCENVERRVHLHCRKQAAATLAMVAAVILVAPMNTSSLAAAAAVASSPTSSSCGDRQQQHIDDSFEDLDASNESLVEAAWQVVDNVYLDARGHKWSRQAWLAEKNKVLQQGSVGKNRAAAYSAIRNMLSSLNDPFTRFLTPTEFARMSKYDITGIGLNIGEVPEEDGQPRLRVIGIIIDSPADVAGIQEGDELVSVDGTLVTGMSPFQAASAIQGRKGTAVELETRHQGCETSQKYVVTRQQELESPVLYKLERSDDPSHRLRGYIRLREFNALTKKDLVTAMERLTSAGATSFVLDLRDNLGGLVQEGIEVAKLFLEDGDTVVYTERRDNPALEPVVAKGKPLSRAPLVVLVNNRTASASEIVAAALRDNCRAVLVGSKTFGKGLIQSVYELNDGSGMVLTVGKYVTPRHLDIDKNGLERDFKDIPSFPELEQKLKTCKEL